MIDNFSCNFNFDLIYHDVSNLVSKNKYKSKTRDHRTQTYRIQYTGQDFSM